MIFSGIKNFKNVNIFDMKHVSQEKIANRFRKIFLVLWRHNWRHVTIKTQISSLKQFFRQSIIQ